MSSRSAWPTGGRISKEKRTKNKVSKDKKKTSQGSSSNQQVEPERSPVKFPRVEDFHLLPRLAFPSEFGRHLPHGRGGGGVLRLGLSDITTFAPPGPRLGTARPAEGVHPPSLSPQVGSAPVYSGVVLSRRQTDPRLRRGSAVPLGAPSAASAPSASSGSADPGLCPSSDPAREMSTPARRRLMRDFKR